MSSSSTAVTFQWIPEKFGGTLTFDPQSPPEIGTYGCYTCVGVYFKIDDTRAFFAHINASSEATWPYNLVTQGGSAEITRMVYGRLCGHALRHRWNTSHKEFGRGLTIICPFGADLYYGSQYYRRCGRFVVAATRNFFHDCSRALLSEISSVIQLPYIHCIM
jgi:hypothetical protein